MTITNLQNYKITNPKCWKTDDKTLPIPDCDFTISSLQSKQTQKAQRKFTFISKTFQIFPPILDHLLETPIKISFVQKLCKNVANLKPRWVYPQYINGLRGVLVSSSTCNSVRHCITRPCRLYNIIQYLLDI